MRSHSARSRSAKSDCRASPSAHDGTAAIVALRDENGAAVLSIDGLSVSLTKERIATAVNPYAVDVSSDGHWAVIGNTGISRTVDDADVVTLVDVTQRPFRAVQQISVSATPEGVAISPDGRWIAVSAMAGSNLLVTDPGRHKLGTVALFAIQDGKATKVERVAGRRSRAGRGPRRRTARTGVIVQFDVERALAPLRRSRRKAGRHSANVCRSPPARRRSARRRAEGPLLARPRRHNGVRPARAWPADRLGAACAGGTGSLEPDAVRIEEVVDRLDDVMVGDAHHVHAGSFEPGLRGLQYRSESTRAGQCD